MEGHECDYAQLQAYDEHSAVSALATSASALHSQAKPRPFQDKSIVEGHEREYAQQQTHYKPSAISAPAMSASALQSENEQLDTTAQSRCVNELEPGVGITHGFGRQSVQRNTRAQTRLR